MNVSQFCPNGPYGAADRSHVVLPDGRLLFFVGLTKYRSGRKTM